MLADLSLDLDNLWAYLRTRGDKAWESYPTYLPRVVPHILEILGELDLKITVFVVGKDAELEENQDAIRQIADAGHEIANHSYLHQPWLQRYSAAEIIEEFDRSEAAITALTGVRQKGFRAPGYSLCPLVLEQLCKRGYLYDCSTLPTYLGPAARFYYLLETRFSAKELEERKELFGKFSDGLRSLSAYYWSTDEGELLELPVSTFPVVKLPFHYSYLHYLAQLSGNFPPRAFQSLAFKACRLTRIQPSVLLHPLDFLGGDEVPQMGFFPGMKIDGERKRAFVRSSLAGFQKRFQVLTMQERASALELTKDQLPRKKWLGS